ncbi:MAG TPA: hypothetical protein VK274_02385 [Pyrinomonadaceae bacterium]|nr:hypothetical protein [Pyrinomonadaceae bacterium]
MSQTPDEVRAGTVKNNKSTRWLIYAAILALVFLLGFVPTCMVARRRGIERDTAQSALRISNMQNSLGNAIVDARAGNYELARQGTSDFFTKLGAEIEQGRNSIFNPAQETKLRSLLEERDNTITMLARNDNYSPDQLTKLYNQYREAVVSTPAP